MRLHPLLAGTLALGVAFGAVAQTIYRCGPDGRTYQQSPCPEGRAIDASDARTAEQRKAAEAAARSEARLAAQIDDDRSASAPVKRSKVKAAPSDKAASAAKSGPKKTTAQAQPMRILAPPGPKAAGSAPRP